ncbi:MAG: cupin domain-containing protein [Deltaproteobacteria bacterium]|nr:cupin domain-containing protein [Deltaproteobacteria bacterium]
MKLEELDRLLAEKNLAGFWTGNVTGFDQNIEPSSPAVPYLWKWADIYDGLMKARELVNLAMSERRTLRLVNPGLPEKLFATPTIHISVQLVRPGELARAHRHSMTAIRFVVKGSGAFTTVEGERFTMRPGDLILTPNWSWHDHYNNTEEDIIWLDGHDGPLVKALDVIAVEMFNQRQQPIETIPDFSLYQYGMARPYETKPNFFDPPFKYSWEQTYGSLRALAMTEGDPYDGVLLRYINPRTGGPTLRTFGCEIQMLRPNERTKSHRHTSHTIYHAFAGSGCTTVGDHDLNWSQGDCFTVPSWQWHRHDNLTEDEAILFSITDRPLKQSLGFYREEGRPD